MGGLLLNRSSDIAVRQSTARWVLRLAQLLRLRHDDAALFLRLSVKKLANPRK